jgi:hypothetical protein
MLSREAAITILLAIGLIQPEFEPMIYRTQGNQANHLTTNVVQDF